MTGERNKLIWGEIVARAWRDAAFKQQLLSNPKAVLTEAGMSVPEDVELQVVQDTPTLRHLVLPPTTTRNSFWCRIYSSRSISISNRNSNNCNCNCCDCD
ncbi:MAG: NHLP leader peptide family natural product precursor [Microcystis aeruginosa LG13-03]|nr:NHLP leader peptide family natural product precursor [Microcystis aeruginosa LG13-03]